MDSAAESGTDSSWMARQQSQGSLGYPPGLFSPLRYPGLQSADSGQYDHSADRSDMQHSEAADWSAAAFGSSFPASGESSSLRPPLAQGQPPGSLHSIGAPYGVQEWHTPQSATAHSVTLEADGTFTFPVMPPGLGLGRSNSAPEIDACGAAALFEPKAAPERAEREVWQGEATQHQLPTTHSLQTPFDSHSLFSRGMRLVGSDTHVGAVESAGQSVLHRAGAPGTALITPEAARHRVDQRQGASPGGLTPETFRTAVESPQSSQSIQEFRSALSDSQSPDGGQRSYSLPAWTPDHLQHTAQSRLTQPPPLADTTAEDSSEHSQLGFSDSHDADESASDCYSAVETPIHHGDSLQRALSFLSLQTVDEEEPADDVSPFRKAGRARRAKPATSQGRAAGRVNGGTSGRPEGRR